MCERLPPWVFETDRLSRRSLVAGAGAVVMGMCMPMPWQRRVRRPEVATAGTGFASPLAPQTTPAVAETTAPAPPEIPVLPEPPLPEDVPWRVFRRSEWGAEPLKPNHDPMNGIERITLHHTAELPGMEVHSDLELVKGIQHYHRNGRGWADIGYHWVIGRDGNLYEGRELHVQGAHAGGDNNVHNLGISVVGDFTHGLPEGPQLETLQGFLEQQMALHEVPAHELSGHRDYKATECPGTALYAWLEERKKT